MNIHSKINNFIFAISAILTLLTLTGCSSYLNFTNTLPSEYNLEGVSKIAIVDFNSLPDDPITGVYTVDDETKKIVKDMISTVFFKGKTYKIANLNAENTILKSDKIINIALKQRFDAILYGRLWWKVTPEYKNIIPKVYNLENWYYETYVSGLTSNGYPIYSRARLTDYTKEVMKEHKYRAKNATLMLSIALYKLNRNGEIEKIVEDFAAADQNFLLLNGEFSTSFVPHYENKLSKLELINLQSEDKNEKKKRIEKELAGFIDKNQNATTIPTKLQTKIMLGRKLANALSSKMTPSEIITQVEFDFSVPEITNKLMTSGNFSDAKQQLITYLYKNLGYKLTERIGSLSAYDNIKVQVLNEEANLFTKLETTKDPEIIKQLEKIIENLIEDAVDDYEDELYALAICEEATRKYDYALENYRILLKYCPDAKYARGISRCLTSLDLVEKLQVTKDNLDKATKKSSMK